MTRNPKNKVVNCVRIIRDTDPSIYALPTDGRKFKRQQEDRRSLAMQLATFADSDGTSIMPGASKLMKQLRWSRDKLFWLLNDLKTLGFLKNEEGRTGRHGTKRRSLNLVAIIAKMSLSEIGDSRSLRSGVSQSEIGMSESDIDSSQSEIGASESEIQPHATDYSLPSTQTNHNKPGNKATPKSVHATVEKPSSAVVVGEDKTPSELKAARERIIGLFIKVEKEAPDTTKAHDKAIEGLIAKHSEETVGKVLRRDLQDSAFFVGKDGQRTKFPLVRFLKRFDRLLMELNATASASKLTREVIDRSNAVANAAHEEVWAVKDEEKATAEDFLKDE